MAIALVNHGSTTNTSGASGTSLVLTLGWTPTVGNTLLVSVGAGGGGTITGVQDSTSGSNSWTKDVQSVLSALQLHLWRAPVVVTPTTVTLTAGSAAWMFLMVSEWSGMDAAPLDGTSTGSAGSNQTSATSNAATSTGTGDLLFCGISTGNGSSTQTITVQGGFTELANLGVSHGNGAFESAYLLNQAAGSHTATWTIGGTGDIYASGIACYKAAAGGGGGGTAPSYPMLGGGGM